MIKDTQTRCSREKSTHPRTGLGAFIAEISARKVQRAGRFLGTLAFHLDIPHRRIVRRNLAFIYPHWDPARIKKFTKQIFQNIGITFAEICQMMVLSKKDILGRMRVTGIEHLSSALKAESGAILISAHLGNWEMIPLTGPFYLDRPFVAVARKLPFDLLNRFILKLRSRFSTGVIDKEGAFPEMRKVLRRGDILGIMIDQGVKRSEGLDVNFLGRKARATPAAALLALRCKSPAVPIFCVREPDGGLHVMVSPPLDLKRTGNLREDLKNNTQVMTDAVEKAVSNYPQQWFWVHKRWKAHYPEMFPEYQRRRKRRRARKYNKKNHERT
ncbi:MAG: lysophospholipid acyltransferase family protein [Desulfobacterales bacterium]|jgi:KDO2-lipid IV(A) lauroyltransferase